MRDSMPGDVIIVGNPVASSELLISLHRAGIDGIQVIEADDVASESFDDGADCWLLALKGGGVSTARAVVDVRPTDTAKVGRDGITPSSSVERFGTHAYLGVARHGFPNRFTAENADAVAHVVACLQALANRGCTRVEVKSHVQCQFSRNMDAGRAKLNPRKAALADYEFTRAEDRDDDEDYRGPALLIGADGRQIEVSVHLLAVFQPIENSVRWTGRVQQSDELSGLHRELNQPVQIRIGDGEPRPALLVDSDPWGGSHIVGAGEAPYPMPLADQLAEFKR